ncbi:Putative AC9 transposase, partial [Linum grandiflorum]
ARDLLAVPVTSVASKSAFSSGGRLLDPHRSRLHFGTIEALMFTRSWIKDDLMKDARKDEIEGLDSFFSAMMMEDPSCEGFENGDFEGQCSQDMDFED